MLCQFKNKGNPLEAVKKVVHSEITKAHSAWIHAEPTAAQCDYGNVVSNDDEVCGEEEEVAFIAPTSDLMKKSK